MGQAAEARDPQRRPAQDVLQPVQVVAGLGHQHRRGQVAAPPVAADVGMGLVPEADRLQVLDAHDVAEPAGVGDLLDRARVRRVAHHVADGEHDAGLLHGGHDPPAPRLVRRHRLFQQDVIAERGERLGRPGVHPVLRADQHRVGQPAAAGKLGPAGDRVRGWYAMLGGEAGAAGRAGFGDRDDGGAFGVAPGPPGVPGAALACPDDDQRNRCHTDDLPVRTSGQVPRFCVLIVDTGRTRDLGHWHCRRARASPEYPGQATCQG
jgi:hypothetical protein